MCCFPEHWTWNTLTCLGLQAKPSRFGTSFGMLYDRRRLCHGHSSDPPYSYEISKLSLVAWPPHGSPCCTAQSNSRHPRASGMVVKSILNDAGSRFFCQSICDLRTSCNLVKYLCIGYVFPMLYLQDLCASHFHMHWLGMGLVHDPLTHAEQAPEPSGSMFLASLIERNSQGHRNSKSVK